MKESTESIDSCLSSIKLDIGSYQPNNPFKDLLILTPFNSVARHFLISNDEQQLIIGDDSGKISVWSLQV
jgi:hypothetical protein